MKILPLRVTYYMLHWFLYRCGLSAIGLQKIRIDKFIGLCRNLLKPFTSAKIWKYLHGVVANINLAVDTLHHLETIRYLASILTFTVSLARLSQSSFLLNSLFSERDPLHPLLAISWCTLANDTA